jgi:hypothetical protein
MANIVSKDIARDDGERVANSNEESQSERAIVDCTVDLTMLRETVKRIRIQINALE